MDIKHIENERNGDFIAEQGGVIAGTLTYAWLEDELISLDKIQVEEDFKSSNAAKKLVLELVDFARKNSAKIKPEDALAKEIFQKTLAFQDVLA